MKYISVMILYFVMVMNLQIEHIEPKADGYWPEPSTKQFQLKAIVPVQDLKPRYLSKQSKPRRDAAFNYADTWFNMAMFGIISTAPNVIIHQVVFS